MTAISLSQDGFRRYVHAGTGRQALLILSCAVAALSAAVMSDAGPVLAADIEIARVLRAMALIKAAILTPLLGALVLRLSQPVASRKACTYVAGAATMCSACTLMWQLTAIGLASMMFYAGLFVLIATALRDRDLLVWHPGHRGSN